MDLGISIETRDFEAIYPFFISTSKFSLKLNVLNFVQSFKLKCSYLRS